MNWSHLSPNEYDDLKTIVVDGQDTIHAFEWAVFMGAMTYKPVHPDYYIGNFMYMYSKEALSGHYIDYFKHKETKNYVTVKGRRKDET
jgi:hypothetical protein